MILVANPHAQYQSYKNDIDAAIRNVLEKGRYVLGDEVRLFEEEFAHFLGASGAVGVGSGTEALHVALKACGIGAGDEVITVSHTAVATAAAIELAGATPVFVDIEPTFYAVDPAQLEKAITPKTKAIIPVHIYGHPVDLKPVLDIAKRYKLRVIEDCAQAHGAQYDGRRVGTWGDIGCFSFYPTKNLGALGDGGALVSNDAALLKRARLLREYGWAERYVSHEPGWNSRLDELQAALLRVKLKHLDQDNAKRVTLAQTYHKNLKGLTLPAERAGSKPVYHLYVVRSPKRDALKAHLEKAGVQALIHYPVPIHLQPAYQKRLVTRALPHTELAAKEILSLPLYPELTQADQHQVIQAIHSFQG